MSDKPAVTVLMPIYNALPYLPQAVDSILGQTFRDFEFLVIDDGSTDGSTNYIENIQDARVRMLRNETNQGLTRSLNLGLHAAQGNFIARMDGDDIADPDRLSTQIAYLRAHPDIGIIGSNALIIDRKGKNRGEITRPQTDLQIRWILLLGSPFIHSSVMIRMDLIREHKIEYNSPSSEDYALWVQLMGCTRAENLPINLISYRQHSASISETKKMSQLNSQAQISNGLVNKLFPDLNLSIEKSLLLCKCLMGHREFPRTEERSMYIAIYLKLWQAFSGLHAGQNELIGLQRRVVAQAGRMLLRHPDPSGSAPVLEALRQINRNWFLWTLFSIIYRRRFSL